MLNKVQIIGYLGQKPELKITTGGSSVCEFSVATSERWKDKTGEQKEQTEWHRVIFWSRAAEVIAEHFDKGSMIYVEGKIQTRKWQDKDGNDRYTTEIIGQNFKFLERKGGGGGSKPQRQDHNGPPGDTSFDDSDIPF